MITLHDVNVETAGAAVYSRPLTVEVRPGRLLGIAGTSGVGKTLLLRLLAGEVEPGSGSVTGETESSIWVPQSNDLADILTATENVAVPLLIHDRDGHAAEAAALEALGSVGLEDSADHLVEELSGGQQQRVAVARALAHPAALLLADEPTTALDAGNRRRVLQLLRDQATPGAPWSSPRTTPTRCRALPTRSSTWTPRRSRRFRPAGLSVRRLTYAA